MDFDIKRPTVSISGTVSDQNQAVIVGARVSLTSHASGETRVVTSSDEGAFSFSGLGEGTFTVAVESPGFVTSQIHDIKVASRQEQRVDVTLQVGPMGGDVVSVVRPLRVLYKESELIVVARIGESQTLRRDRAALRVRTSLHVLTILKGKSKHPLLDLYHWSYGDLTGPFVAGEEMLLFLNRTTRDSVQGSPVGYEVGDTQYGIKKVAGDELTAYQNRIAELSQIYRGAGPFDVAIVKPQRRRLPIKRGLRIGPPTRLA